MSAKQLNATSTLNEATGDEGAFCVMAYQWLSGAREVERHAPGIGPEMDIANDERGATLSTRMIFG